MTQTSLSLSLLRFPSFLGFSIVTLRSILSSLDLPPGRESTQSYQTPIFSQVTSLSPKKKKVLFFLPDRRSLRDCLNWGGGIERIYNRNYYLTLRSIERIYNRHYCKKTIPMSNGDPSLNLKIRALNLTPSSVEISPNFVTLLNQDVPEAVPQNPIM